MTTETREIVWGAAAISDAIGRTKEVTFRALQEGKIPGARKIAGRWAFNPRVYLASFEEAST